MWRVIELAVNLFQSIIVIETITRYLQVRYEDFRRKIFPVIAVIVIFIELSYINHKMKFEGLAIVIPIIIMYVYDFGYDDCYRYIYYYYECYCVDF